MPTKRISFSNFNRRLFPIGGREQGPPGSMRIAQNVDPLVTNSVLSRWGSLPQPHTPDNIDAIQMWSIGGQIIAYDGSTLWGPAGQAITSGYNGNRIAVLNAPPQPGQPDWLFICGGGVQPTKVKLPIASSPVPYQWGINQPANASTGLNLTWDQTVVDNLNASHTAWSATNTSVSDDSSEFQTGTGSLKVDSTSATAGPWRIVNDTFPYASPSTGSPLNLGTYANGDISLETDVIQFWVYYALGSTNSQLSPWLQIDFDVNDGTFKKDWYSYGIGFLNANNPSPSVNHNVNTTIAMQPTQWQQVTIAKSQFLRYGTHLNLDWTNVIAVRFSGLIMTASGDYLLLDNLTMSGGAALGAGPAVGNGGSEYDYYIVYRNLSTGSQSNPSPEAFKIYAVADNKVKLTNIPISPDTQVTARDIYRSQAGGGDAFYLDTIWDNSTTVYTDVFTDATIRQAVTPWQPSVAVPPNSAAPYYIDAGNGYYFLLTTNGTTGATPPQWIIPTTVWAPQASFALGETVGPTSADGDFWEVTQAGISGGVQPPWATAGTPGDTLTDGVFPNQIIWTNLGPQTTTDNTAVWTFQGINSTLTLSDVGLLFDNAPPLITYQDAVGLFQGSVLWTADSANPAYVYASPPGRPESVGQAYQMTTTSDGCQKLSIWDGALWLHTTDFAFQITGNYPEFVPSIVNNAIGTRYPLTVVPIQQMGIIYWATDGLRLVNWAGSRLFGFDQLSEVFRGQSEEGLPAWTGVFGGLPNVPATNPAWIVLNKNELIISDGTALTLGIAYDGLLGVPTAWRRITPVFTAAVYSYSTGLFYASFDGGISAFEVQGYTTDEIVEGSPPFKTLPIAFQIQTMADFPDPGQEFTVQRIYLTLNTQVSPATSAEKITPQIIVDGTAYTLPVAQAAGRKTIEYDGPKVFGRFLDGFNLSGSLLLSRVEIFRVECDIWLGE